MPKKKLIATITILLTLLALASIAWFFPAFGAPKNYAKQTAEPIEAALMKAGAVKKCEDGDAGRGSDNQAPWYHAIYEVASSKDETAERLKSIAQANGYKLVDDSQEVNAEDRLYLGDRKNKRSSYAALKEGNVELLATVYSSQAFAENSMFCSVAKKSAPNSNTTFDITLTLPEYK